MLFTLRNYSNSELSLSDIGLVIPLNGEFLLDSSNINNFLQNGSSLYNLLASNTAIGSVTYPADGVTPVMGDNSLVVLAGTKLLKRSEALVALTGGIASETFYDNTISGLTSVDVKSALDEVNTKVASLASVTPEYRNGVLAISQDAQLNVAGPLTIASMTFPLSDDEGTANVTVALLTSGKFILYKGATASDDKLWKSDGTTLTLQTGTEGLVNNYAYVVDNDLINTPDAKEKQSFYVYITSSGLTKLSDVNWGGLTLEDAYTNGDGKITVIDSKPLTLGKFTVTTTSGTEVTSIGGGIVTATNDGTNTNIAVATTAGDVTVASGKDVSVSATGEVSIKDSRLTTAIPLTESASNGDGTAATMTGLSSNFVQSSQTDFNWTRKTSSVAPSSIIGALNATRDDLWEYVELLSTQGAAVGVAAGSNLIGVDGISNVTPTGGTAGADGTLQAMLEGIATKVASAGGKVYANIAAFTTAKAAGTTYNVGEVVYIADINTFVEVITSTTAIIQGTDWEYVGNTGNAIGGQRDEILSLTAKATGTTTISNKIGTNAGITVARDATNSVSTVVISGDSDAAAVTVTDSASTKSVAVNANFTFNFPVTAGSSTYVGAVNGATYFDSAVGAIMAYDATRTKWVDINKKLLQFGASTADGQYLTIDGVQSGLSGFIVPKAAVITGITIKAASGNLTKEFQVRVNGVTTAISTVALVAGIYAATDTNVNLAANDFVQIFATADGSATTGIVATIEFAYRA
jgi:hypothetical protein